MTSLVLLAALLMAGPSLVAALSGEGAVDTALVHLLLALVVAAVGGRVLRQLVTSYDQHPAAAAEAGAELDTPARRRTDAPDLTS